MILLEACSNSVRSSIEAQKGGASRVELCDNLAEGGTTPALSQIELSRKYLHIKLYPLIRPRGGDFLYTDIEFETMKLDVHHCGKTKCDGVAIGILNSDGSIDKARNKELINIAHSYKMGVTFHRAFDRCNNLKEALEDIIDLGCERVLTSGGKKTALDGKETIRDLIKQANDRIIIMPGAGITENNISELVETTGLKEFHGSFRTRYNSDMKFITENIDSYQDEYTMLLTDKNKIEQAIKNANTANKLIN